MSIRLTSCTLVVLLSACGGADRSDDAAAPPQSSAAPAAAAPAAPAPAPSAAPVESTSAPVSVGGYGDMDACGGYAQVRSPAGAPPGGVEVRQGPGSQYAVIDRLPEGTAFSSCDSAGDWSGIVYPPPGTETDCGVGSPIETRGPYSGPCRSGWIPSAYAELLAG
jgi:hypothetical protein